MATLEVLWVRKILNHFDCKHTSPLKINADNGKAIQLAQEERTLARSKCIHVCYHITRDYISKGFI